MAKKKKYKQAKKQSTSKYNLEKAKVLLTRSSRPSSRMSKVRHNPPSSVISYIRQTIVPENYAPFLSWLQKRPVLFRQTFASSFPSQLKDLYPYDFLKQVSLANEIKWCYCRLEPHMGEIKSFIELKEEINDAFIVGNKDHCLELLDELESKLGFSFWLIKKKIALLQHFEGLEQQKKFTSSIKDDTTISGIIKYISHFISYRCEPSVSPFSFDRVYHNLLNEVNFHPGLSAYLRQHIVGISPKTEDELAAMLCIEVSGTAIDTYEMFITCTQCIVTMGLDINYPFLPHIIQELADTIEDVRLSRLLFLLNKCDVASSRLRLFGHQDISRIFSKIESETIHSFSSMQDFEDNTSRLNEALSLAIMDENSDVDELPISNEMYSSIRSILNGKSDYISAASNLIKTEWVLEGSCAADFLLLILNWSINNKLDPNDKSSWYEHIVGLGHISFFELWWISEQDLRARYIDIFTDLQADIPIWLKLEDKSSNSLEHTTGAAEDPFYLWRLMHSHLKNGENEPALSIGTKLLEEDNGFLRRQAIRIIPYSLLKLGKTMECVHFLAKHTLDDKSLELILPIKEVYESLSDTEKESMTGSIDFVVFTDQYVTKAGQDLAYLRSYASEDFLADKSMQKPSQLRIDIKSYDRNLLIYFLSHICVESVMDTWVTFKSSQDVALERAGICQLLTEINPDSREKYQAEIRDIMRKIALRERLREVEQSKIYIDTASVKAVARQTLQESFTRYMDFIRTGMTVEDKSMLEASKRLSQVGVNVILSESFPRNEMSDLFESIVSRLRDEFVSSSQHGLDGYLSVRIRHGTLAGQLRAPFEAEHLITLRDSKSGKYKANSYWPPLLHITGTSQEAELQQIFHSFTESFDKLIEEIKSSWIQIKKQHEGTGLIDFRIRRSECIMLSAGIQDDMSFDSFLEYVFDFFLTAKLEPSLFDIREKLKNIAKPRIAEMLIQLQSKAEELLASDVSWELRAAIGRARTQIQTVLERITEWFRLSKVEMLSEPFRVEEAVNIGVASIRSACPDFEVNFKTPPQWEDYHVIGSLPSFVDLMFLVFENAVRHSHMPTPEVDVTVTCEKNLLHIHMENSLGASVMVSDAVLALEKIRNNLLSNAFSESLIKEGGTGFYKMQKILDHDFSSPSDARKPELNFGIKEDSIFFVDIKIPINDL